jgi:Flp pilus assembly protein TadG
MSPMNRTNLLKSFGADRRGVAAIELAVVAPLFALVAAGVASIAPYMTANSAMHEAVAAGRKYAMAGETSPVAVQQITMSAWSGRQQGDSAQVSQYCSCADVQGSCTTLCTDGSVPHGYMVIAAQSHLSGTIGDRMITAQQIIRTR